MSELTGTYEDEIEASLKPCPRCNGKALIENFDEILCDSCGLWSGDDWPSLDEAVEWWNKQPHIEALNQRIAELEACNNELESKSLMEFATVRNTIAEKDKLIAELEAASAMLRQSRDALLEQLERATHGQIRLEAQAEWEPAIYSTFIDDDSHDETYLLATLGGTQLEIGTDPTSDGVTVNLPKEYRLCRRKEGR